MDPILGRIPANPRLRNRDRFFIQGLLVGSVKG